MRVLIADDEPPARRKLRRLLEAEPDVEIAGEAGTVEETRRAIEKTAARMWFFSIYKCRTEAGSTWRRGSKTRVRGWYS